MLKYLAKRLDVIVVLILIASIGLNFWFYFHKTVPVVQTITKIKEIKVPESITEVKLAYKTCRITSDASDSSNFTVSEKADLYDQLLQEDLKIKTSPIDIVEDRDGHIYISKFVTGTVELNPLMWNVIVDLKPKEVYRKPILPIDVGYVINTKLDPDIGIVFSVPFIDKIDIMFGIQEYNICYNKPLTRFSNWRVGLSKTYNGDMSLTVGLKTKLF